MNTTNNIILVAYGSENIEKLDKKEMIKVLNEGFYSPLELTKTMHFNPKYPEYHNVYISNMKDKYGMVYDGQNWAIITKEALIDKIFDDKTTLIDQNLETFIDTLTKSKKNALRRWLEASTDDEDINETMTKVKEQIKVLLYNSRSLPINLRNECLANVQRSNNIKNKGVIKQPKKIRVIKTKVTN
jgi:hypothetical protein